MMAVEKFTILFNKSMSTPW